MHTPFCSEGSVYRDVVGRDFLEQDTVSLTVSCSNAIELIFPIEDRRNMLSRGDPANSWAISPFIAWIPSVKTVSPGAEGYSTHPAIGRRCA